MRYCTSHTCSYSLHYCRCIDQPDHSGRLSIPN